MARWNKTLKENSIDILNEVICNVHPLMHDKILIAIEIDQIANRKQIIEKYIRTKMNLVDKQGSRTIAYWTRRGWDLASAYVNTQKDKPRKISPFSVDFWLSKINPTTNQHFTPEEADFERNSRRPIRKEYWIKQGLCELDAQAMALLSKDNNNKVGAKNAKLSVIRPATNTRCVEFYLARGFNADEATVLQSDSQRHFSKDICIAKYGVKEGLEVWSLRQKKWKDSLKKSGIYLGVSTTSLKLFNNLALSIPTLQYGKNEAIIKCNDAVYSVDCLHGRKIIEYYGDYWHANPKKYSSHSKIKSKIAATIWANDAARQKLLEDQGYQVLVVWESETTHDLPGTIAKCLNFLTQ